MSYRTSYIERDLSGFASANMNETGAMVVHASKGPATPKLCQTPDDVILHFGKPSATYPAIFEALAFTKAAPCWIARALGDSYAFGGIDIKLASVVGFGTGRDYDTFTYANPPINTVDTLGTGDGTKGTWTGTLLHYPILAPSVQIKIDGVAVDATVSSSGVITGDDIAGSGSLALTSGIYGFTFDGTSGVVATVTSTVDGSGNYDLSSGAVDKLVNVTIDGTLYANVNLGQSATTTRASVISAINTAVGSTVATTSGTKYIKVSGLVGSATGSVIIANPTSGSSALTTVFSPTTLSGTGTAPTGSIPKAGEVVTMSYTYTGAAITDVSHSFWSASPYDDDLAASIEYVSGSKFTLTLYRVTSAGNVLIQAYDYSLIRELDAFGRSLYIFDVFDENPYVIPTVNTAFTGTAYVLPGTSVVAFSGGATGDDPTTSDYTTAWNHFVKRNKYPAKIFMDVVGNSAYTINSIIQTYQDSAQGISCVPLGSSYSEALSFRSSLGLDTDDVGLYTNWTRIEDNYNNSSAWISMVGSVGKKFAMMEDTYDAASPAGIDENLHGGQLNDWRVLEVENDYSDAQLEGLDVVQINPIVFDEFYGLMAYGDKTLQVTNSDTSFVGTRRLYKYMIDVITKQILRKQEFKINDPLHRLMAKAATDSFIEPIFADGWIRDFYVQCDEKNNDDNVLNQRKFLLDVYVKIQPNAQFTQLRLTRLSQTQVIADFIK